MIAVIAAEVEGASEISAVAVGARGAHNMPGCTMLVITGNNCTYIVSLRTLVFCVFFLIEKSLQKNCKKNKEDAEDVKVCGAQCVCCNGMRQEPCYYIRERHMLIATFLFVSHPSSCNVKRQLWRDRRATY